MTLGLVALWRQRERRQQRKKLEIMPRAAGNHEAPGKSEWASDSAGFQD